MENRKNQKKLSKSSKHIIMKIKDTDLPDVYELYCYNNDKLSKYGIASVQSLKISQLLNMIFAEIESERGMSIFVIYIPHMDNCHSTIALLLDVFTSGEASICLAHRTGVP